MTEQLPADDAMVSAWSDYLAARDKAEASRNILDGIAAAHKWRSFIDLYEGSPSPSSSNVVPLRREALCQP